MSLFKKIEDKLSGSSDSKKLEKSDHSSSSHTDTTETSGSKLQHPISSGSSAPTGSAVGTSSGNVPSSYPQNTSGYTSTSGAADRMPRGYVTDETHAPSSTTSSSARHPFDPYSSKGQETAARTGHHPSSTGQTMDDPSIARSKDGGIMNQSSDSRYAGSQQTSGAPTTSSHHYERDAAVAGGAGALGAGGVGAYEMDKDEHSSQPTSGAHTSTSRDGGVMGQYDDQRYGGSQTGSGAPTSTSQTTSSHHYGRDAAVAGGVGAVGAGGVGAYEMGKDKPSSQPLTDRSRETGQQQDPSYMQQSQPSSVGRDTGMAGGAMGASQAGGSSAAGSAISGESPGLTQARKMGGAYEAGYKDAMEHMQAELKSRGISL